MVMVYYCGSTVQVDKIYDQSTVNEEIKSKIGEFLRDELKLELSGPKSLINRAASRRRGSWAT